MILDQGNTALLLESERVIETDSKGRGGAKISAPIPQIQNSENRIFIYIYIYIYVSTCYIYIYVYTYIHMHLAQASNTFLGKFWRSLAEVDSRWGEQP